MEKDRERAERLGSDEDEAYNSPPPPRTPSYSNKEGTLLSQMHFLIALLYLIQNANTSQIPTRPSPRGTKWGLCGENIRA